MTIQDALSKVSPSDGSIRRDLAISCNNLGMVQSQEHQFTEAESSFARAYELQRGLLRDQPEDVQLLSNVGGVLNNLGMLYDRQRRWADAEVQYKKAVDSQRQAVELAPDSGVFRELLSKHYFNYARNLREQHKPEEAAKVSLERKKLWPNQPDRLYSVAQELTAACQAMATTSRSTTEAQQGYWQAAVDTLRDAVAAGLPVDRLNDSSLKALSDRDEFRKLLVETHTSPANSNGSDQAPTRQLN
jgi:tetratricopeptide (TPR) repeat protein